MRRIIPSLPIFAYWTAILRIGSVVKAESLPEVAIKPRAVFDSRSERRWSRAALPEPANDQLQDGGVDKVLEERQQTNSINQYAFSGAVYIVGDGGVALNGLNSASPAYCPNSAPQSCGNIQVWNWHVSESTQGRP